MPGDHTTGRRDQVARRQLNLDFTGIRPQWRILCAGALLTTWIQTAFWYPLGPEPPDSKHWLDCCQEKALPGAPEGSVNFLTTTLRSTYCCLTSSPGPFAYIGVDLECINGRAAICVSLYKVCQVAGCWEPKLCVP
jgi:hypothetical protein